jgi:diaminopimelate epimerase
VTATFHKMHGLGNDFVIFEREEAVAMTPALARAIADRRMGVGCDQLIVLGPSDVAAVAMAIWNADGSMAQACGNASRCVVALTGATTIETAGGVIEGATVGAEVEVSLGEPRFTWDTIPLAYPMETRPVPLAWDEFAEPIAINVGNPHVVFFTDVIDERRLAEVGPRIEHDPAFPERINVNLASVADGVVTLRTWERGAGLTLACGTGACATAVAAILTRRAVSPVRVEMAGGSLSITWAPGEAVRMRGSASHVFKGAIDLGAMG